MNHCALRICKVCPGRSACRTAGTRSSATGSGRRPCPARRQAWLEPQSTRGPFSGVCGAEGEACGASLNKCSVCFSPDGALPSVAGAALAFPCDDLAAASRSRRSLAAARIISAARERWMQGLRRNCRFTSTTLARPAIFGLHIGADQDLSLTTISVHKHGSANGAQNRSILRHIDIAGISSAAWRKADNRPSSCRWGRTQLQSAVNPRTISRRRAIL